MKNENSFFSSIIQIINQYSYIAAASAVTILVIAIGGLKYKFFNSISDDELEIQIKNKLHLKKRSRLINKLNLNELQNKFNEIMYQKEQMVSRIDNLEKLKKTYLKSGVNSLSKQSIDSIESIVNNQNINKLEYYDISENMIQAYKLQLEYVKEALEIIEREANDISEDMKGRLLFNYVTEYSPTKSKDKNELADNSNFDHDKKIIVSNVVKDQLLEQYKYFKEISCGQEDRNILDFLRENSTSTEIERIEEYKNNTLEYIEDRIKMYNDNF